MKGKKAKVLVLTYQTIRREVVADPSTTTCRATILIEEHSFLFYNEIKQVKDGSNEKELS